MTVLTLSEYPEAIAALQAQLQQLRYQMEPLKAQIADRDGVILRFIAFDPELKNEAQRKARRAEMESDDMDLADWKTELDGLERVFNQVSIELELMVNRFTVAKLEARREIAQLELQARMAE